MRIFSAVAMSKGQCATEISYMVLALEELPSGVGGRVFFVPLFRRRIFSRFWCSLFPKISERKLLSPCPQLHVPFDPLFPKIFDDVPLFPKTTAGASLYRCPPRKTPRKTYHSVKKKTTAREKCHLRKSDHIVVSGVICGHFSQY